jgi:ketosteroid isomerase-like protein
MELQMIRIFVALGVLAVSGLSQAQAAPADEAVIRAAEERFAASVSAKDVDGIMKIYIPTESLQVFDVIPPRQYVGATAYRKDWEGFLGSLKGPVKYEVSDFTVAADRALGYAHSIQHLTATDTKDHLIDLTVRVTDVFRKTNGKWLIVHEHISIPVDLDTGKPDPTSKP